MISLRGYKERRSLLVSFIMSGKLRRAEVVDVRGFRTEIVESVADL